MRGARPVVVVLLAGAALSGLAAVRLDGQVGREPPASLLYLPKGPWLRLCALGQEQLAADLLYLWSIQYYASYEKEDRYRYLEAVYDGAITELDPHYVDAYWIGALILSVEAKDIDGALRLLDKGIRNNPRDWELPYLAGWEAYFHQRYDRAERYFELVEKHPDAPAHIKRVRLALLEKSGRPEEALDAWIRLAQESGDDPKVLGVAHRYIRDLTARILTDRVARFAAARGRRPRDLEELVGAGLLEAVPRTPDGRAYVYDPSTGVVTPPRSGVVKDSR